MKFCILSIILIHYSLFTIHHLAAAPAATTADGVKAKPSGGGQVTVTADGVKAKPSGGGQVTATADGVKAKPSGGGQVSTKPPPISCTS